MLRISKLADYGTVVMVYLAKKSTGLCSAREIAQQTHLAIPTVSKLLKRLAFAGLLVSERGVTGGYKLQRSAADISIADIIYALEEQRGLVECSQPDACSLQSFCHVQGNWRLISQAIGAALDSVSLASLAKPTIESVEIKRIKQLVSGVSRG